MGAEAVTAVTVTDASGAVTAHAPEVKAVLESRELLLRTPLRRVLPVAELSEVVVTADGERLRFRHGAETVELALGAPTAARWAKKLLTPPPTLAAKLGLSAGHPPLVIGPVTDAHLAAALAELSAGPVTASAPNPVITAAGPTGPTDNSTSARTTTAQPTRGSTPAVALAEVDDELALRAALAALPPAVPVWIVHRKGRAPFGDAEVRAAMRSRGFIDTKVSAVSEVRTATRYSPRPTTPPEDRT
ncbi:hypothetical protein VD659_07210 [Herbiconiux sp. 11R-BC]|uniref:hypothetical protein n=1 Tax=Herbiconiux sp. 11R-BC TaxID=3111637 RepID=UPI003BFF540C